MALQLHNYPPLPVGYCFAPTDVQLLNSYLKPKINGTLSTSPYLTIMDMDVYNDHPSNIFAAAAGIEGEGGVDHEDGENGIKRYFFTRLKKATEKGHRIDRRVGNFGTWKGDNYKEIVMPREGTMIGYDRYFKFIPKNRGDKKDAGVEWLMHEYSLLENQEMVICRITRKINKKRGFEEGDNRSIMQTISPPVVVQVGDQPKPKPKPKPKRKRARVGAGHPIVSQRQVICLEDDHVVPLQQQPLELEDDQPKVVPLQQQPLMLEDDQAKVISVQQQQQQQSLMLDTNYCQLALPPSSYNDEDLLNASPFDLSIDTEHMYELDYCDTVLSWS